METDEKTSSVEIKEEPMETSEEKPEPEKTEAKFETINNPCRALNQQLKVLSFTKEQTRYTPLKPLSQGGIILLRDGRPDEAEVYFALKIYKNYFLKIGTSRGSSCRRPNTRSGRGRRA